MAQGLSVLARLVKRGAFADFQQGEKGVRTDPRMPALPGRTRGTLGATGSRPGPATRNPDAQINEERATLNSPIMKAFLDQLTGA